MPKALKTTTPPGEAPKRRPPLTTRNRRGLYALADLLRGEFSMTLAMLRARARERGAQHEHELEAALAWIDDTRRFWTARGKLRRKNLEADPSKRPRQLTPPPLTPESEPSDAPDLFTRD